MRDISFTIVKYILLHVMPFIMEIQAIDVLNIEEKSKTQDIIRLPGPMPECVTWEKPL